MWKDMDSLILYLIYGPTNDPTTISIMTLSINMLVFIVMLSVLLLNVLMLSVVGSNS
jgi:hypothetical protein